jgi:transcriptional regulator with XRE-family HTH domain
MNQVPVIDLAATGDNIRRLRKAAGISVGDMQAALGFANPQSIYKWQRGDGMPSLDNLVIVAAIFGVKVDDILVVH